MLTVQAVNTKGFMNRKSIKVVVQSTDREAPYFVREQSKIVPASEGEGRTASLIFNDHLSAVIGGMISVNGEKLIDFSVRLANFTTSATTVEVEVRDAYDNVLKETISLIESLSSPEPSTSNSLSTSDSSSDSSDVLVESNVI